MRAHIVTSMTRPRRYAWCRAPLLIVLGICALAIPASASASADTLRDWNRHALEALGNPTNPPVPGPVPGAAQSPTVTSIHMAMVQGAVYDAVNSIDRRSSGVSRRTPTRVAVSIAKGRGRHRRPPRARRPRWRARAGVASGGPRSTRRPLRRDARSHSQQRHEQGGWDCGRGRRGRGNACGESERRQIRAVLVPRRRRRRRVASGPAGVRQRPVRMGGQRRAVRPPELFAVPDEGPARAHERRLHEGIQRGEGARGPDVGQSPFRGARGRGPVLHRQCHRAAQPHVPHDLRSRRAQPRRGSPTLWDAEPGRGRQRDRLLG